MQSRQKQRQLISDRYSRIELARQSIPRTLFLVGEDKTASWQWRVDWPCKALSDRGFVADWCMAQNVNGLLPLINAGRYNTLVTPRAHWATTEMADEWLEVIHGYGLAWVYEIDDDGWSPDIVPRQSKLFEQEWRKGENQLEYERQERIRILQKADGIIVSSEQLATVARSYTERPVFCVPNLINSDWFTNRISDAKRIVPPLTVGWSGGLRDEADLDVVANAWRNIAEKFPDVLFVIHGTHPKPLVEAVPPERLRLISWSSLPDYPRALMNIDIMCCAVQEGVGFNKAKTCIKWYESTMSGSTCVVSKTLYGNEVRDGHNALVAETQADWEAGISKLIIDQAYRKRIRRNAQKTIELEHALGHEWPRWIDALDGALDFYRANQLLAKTNANA